MKSSIRIVVVGDSYCGKTTLISSFLKESYDEAVPAVLPEVSIPAEVTVDKVQTFIVDTSCKEENLEHLKNELERADVVCLIYADDSDSSYDRLGQLWIPLIRKHAVKKPIIMVGNKIDLRRADIGADNAKVDQHIIPLMNKFEEIQTCVECSAKEILNVAEVFYFATKAVLHPTTPLYDMSEHKMKRDCELALERVFRLSDKNKDGVLDDDELNAFQKKVFGSPLQQQELEGVKEVVRESIPDGIKDNGLTLKGFVYLHLLFIERNRMDTIWGVLRKFGYDETVQLKHEFLHPPLDVPSDCVTELSPQGFQFLTSLFQAHDRDMDGVLNKEELNQLFATAPCVPWLNDSRVFESAGVSDNGMTLHKFFAMWSMITLIDFQLTLAYLGYLGYEGDTRDAIKILHSGRNKRRKSNPNRTVFHGLVLGPTGAGKTEFLKGLVDHPFNNQYQSNSAPWTVVNSLEVKGAEKYLVLEEVKSDVAWDILQDEHRIRNTDVIIFLYDTSDANSFSYLANLRKLCDINRMPIIFIGTKTDSGLVKQNCELQPEEYTSALQLAAPLMVSMKDRQIADLYHIITEVAMNPSVAIPKKEETGMDTLTLVLSTTIGLSALAVGGFIFFRNFKWTSSGY